MRQKHRYLLAYYNGSDAINIIKRRYAEKFDNEDLQKASLKMISHNDNYLIVRCNLKCYQHLLETLSSLDGAFIPLNTSGTLKALRSRMDKIKERFRGRDINVGSVS